MHKDNGTWTPEPNLDLSRSFGRLSDLARDVVRNTLGLSVQGKEQAEEDEANAYLMEEWEKQMLHYEICDCEPPCAPPVGRKPRQRPKRPDVDLEEWLREKIRYRLVAKLDDVLMHILGIEYKYGKWEISTSSPLYNVFKPMAQKLADEMTKKWFEENSEKVFEKAAQSLVDDQNKVLDHALHDEMRRALREELRNRMRALVTKRAEQIENEVLLGAVDEAMFETFPVLRRMEAAKRLGVDVEKKEETR